MSLNRFATVCATFKPKWLFNCSVCGVEHVGRKGRPNLFCSTACRSNSWSGDGNPNFRNAARRACEGCGAEFQSYNATRKFCTRRCYTKARRQAAKPKAPPTIRPMPVKAKCRGCGVDIHKDRLFCGQLCRSEYTRKKNEISCVECGVRFSTPYAAKRKFCSYECFVSNGGPVRAGNKAAETIMKKYGAKKDANHKEIFDYMRAQTAVVDTSAHGYGMPDGLVWVNGGWQLFDVKNGKTSYGRRGLNARQKEWAKDWRGGAVYLVYTTDDAKALINGEFDQLTAVGGNGGGLS